MPAGSAVFWPSFRPIRFAILAAAAGYAPGQVNAYVAVVEKPIAELNQL